MVSRVGDHDTARGYNSNSARFTKLSWSASVSTYSREGFDQTAFWIDALYQIGCGVDHENIPAAVARHCARTDEFCGLYFRIKQQRCGPGKRIENQVAVRHCQFK